MAGLWEIWHGPAGEVLETCCILTRDAAGIMEGIHSRMPVLLPSEGTDRWLAPDLEEPPKELLMSDLAAQLTCWPVSTRVNSVRNDGPDLIQPVEVSHPPQPTEPITHAIQQDDLFG
jgi:putative SOS response-associated peptidase YedK